MPGASPVRLKPDMFRLKPDTTDAGCIPGPAEAGHYRYSYLVRLTGTAETVPPTLV